MPRATLFHPKADLPPRHGPLIDADLLRAVAGELLGATFAAAEPLPGGTHHRAYRLRRPDGSSIVARTSAGEGGPDQGMLLDRFAAARLRAAGLPAADVLAVDLSRRRCPF